MATEIDRRAVVGPLIVQATDGSDVGVAASLDEADRMCEDYMARFFPAQMARLPREPWIWVAHHNGALAGYQRALLRTYLLPSSGDQPRFLPDPFFVCFPSTGEAPDV